MIEPTKEEMVQVLDEMDHDLSLIATDHMISDSYWTPVFVRWRKVLRAVKRLVVQ